MGWTNFLRPLPFVLLALLSASACGESKTRPTPLEPTPPDAALAVLNLLVTGETQRVGFRYTITFQVQETSGKDTATITSAEFTLNGQSGAIGNSRSGDPLLQPTVDPGATIDSRVLKITDDRAATPYAQNMTVRVNFTDTSDREGFAEVSTTVPPPTTPPATP